MADKKKKPHVVPLPDDKEYVSDLNSEFPDEYYVGPYAPDATENQLLPGTSQWYDTARDAVFRWDGSNWNPDPTAEKWVLDQLTCDPLGRVIGDKKKPHNLDRLSLDDLIQVKL